MKIHSSRWKAVLSIAFAALVGLVSHAQAQQSSADKKIQDILDQMTLDEKLDYITGFGVDFTFTNLKEFSM